MRVEGVLAAAAGGAVDQDAAGVLRPAAATASAAAAVVIASARGEEAAARDGSDAETGVLEQLAAGELPAEALVLVHLVTPWCTMRTTM